MELPNQYSTACRLSFKTEGQRGHLVEGVQEDLDLEWGTWAWIPAPLRELGQTTHPL